MAVKRCLCTDRENAEADSGCETIGAGGWARCGRCRTSMIPAAAVIAAVFVAPAAQQFSATTIDPSGDRFACSGAWGLCGQQSGTGAVGLQQAAAGTLANPKPMHRTPIHVSLCSTIAGYASSKPRMGPVEADEVVPSQGP